MGKLREYPELGAPPPPPPTGHNVNTANILAFPPGAAQTQSIPLLQFYLI